MDIEKIILNLVPYLIVSIIGWIIASFSRKFTIIQTELAKTNELITQTQTSIVATQKDIVEIRAVLNTSFITKDYYFDSLSKYALKGDVEVLEQRVNSYIDKVQ